MTASTRSLLAASCAILLASCLSNGSKQHARGAQPAYANAEHSAPEGSDSGGESDPGESVAESSSRPGLGTEFGERVDSHVGETTFHRASRDPFASVGIYYNDEEGVRAQAAFRGANLQPISARTPHGGLTAALTDMSGRPLPGAQASGRVYVLGRDGDRYQISVRNQTGGRYEVVMSVDGLDVIDGGAAGHGKRGYVLEPYGTITIMGFRTSDFDVAAFRFGAVRDSYAARTGNDRNVGVVGLAFFAERGSRWTTDELRRRESADPFPRKYARPPGW